MKKDLGILLWLMDHNVKALVWCRRYKVARNDFELFVRCSKFMLPLRISRTKPSLTDGIGNVEIM